MSTFYIGLKLGSNNTWIYKSGNGLVLREPTLVAVSASQKNRDFRAFGLEAKALVGRTDEAFLCSRLSLTEQSDMKTLRFRCLKGF